MQKRMKGRWITWTRTARKEVRQIEPRLAVMRPQAPGAGPQLARPGARAASDAARRQGRLADSRWVLRWGAARVPEGEAGLTGNYSPAV